MTIRPHRDGFTLIELPVDPDNPLLSRKVVLCGTVGGEYEFLLPRGTYQLNCYGRSSLDAPETFLAVSPRPTLLVDGKVTTIEMGVLDLVRAPPDRAARERIARNAGRWRDFTKHIGELAPEWHAVDARGITTQTKIRDFRGKWLLIYFWGFGCLPCLENGIPEMIAFYDQHAADRDRFELVGICIDHRGQIRDLRALDDALGPIIAKVWHGRRIRFPLVLDDSFLTWERYGIPGLGTKVLVDPEGNLTKGDLSDLARLLHPNPAIRKD